MALLCLCLLRPSLHYPELKCEGCGHLNKLHASNRQDGAKFPTACRGEAAPEPVASK